MNQENMDKFLDEFPDMFYESSRGPTQPIIRGIDCGDGWFDILYNLCKEIEPMRPKVMQIKEKFGGLRFYCSFPKDYSEKGYVFIRKAEEQAIETCEDCGEPGEFRIHRGWRRVSCTKCHELYIIQKDDEK